MWMTGFDVPSCSTIYLDRPMRNHTLMQTIARANRVFPDKENGLIVDYVGVFRRPREGARDLRGGRDGRRAHRTVIRDKSALVGELDGGARRAARASASAGTSTSTRSRAPRASSSSRCATRAVEALLVDDEVRGASTSRSRAGREAVPAILPDPAAPVHQATVAVSACSPRRSSLGRANGRTSPRSPAR